MVNEIRKEDLAAFRSVCEMFGFTASVMTDEEDYGGIERMCRVLNDYWDDLNPAGIDIDGESEEREADFHAAHKKCAGLLAVQRLLEEMIESGAIKVTEERRPEDDDEPPF